MLRSRAAVKALRPKGVLWRRFPACKGQPACDVHWRRCIQGCCVHAAGATSCQGQGRGAKQGVPLCVLAAQLGASCTHGMDATAPAIGKGARAHSSHAPRNLCVLLPADACAYVRVFVSMHCFKQMPVCGLCSHNRVMQPANACAYVRVFVCVCVCVASGRCLRAGFAATSVWCSWPMPVHAASGWMMPWAG